MEYRRKAIASMYEHSNEAVVFNMASGYPQPINKETLGVFYADSQKVLNSCLELTSRVTFKQHYAKKDFMIALYK